MSRKRIVGIVALVVLAAAAVVAVVAGPASAPSGDTVAVITLSGPIQSGASTALLGGGAITPDLVRDRLDRARDAGADAVVVRLDSPGGQVAASQEIAGMFADAELPVVVSMGDLAASGGYYISATADRIVAQPGTLTGSIGVIWTMVDPTELLEKIGVELQVITQGEHKDMGVPGALDAENRRIIEGITETMYTQFVDAVAEGRDLPREEVLELATGRLFTGAEAREVGLVDILGGLDTAIDEAADLAGIDPATVEILEYEPSFFDLLFGGLNASGLVGGLGDAPRATLELELARALLNGGLLGPRY